MTSPNNSKSREEIPVTLLAGCLGSGKTTFLNYILKENHGKRIAVIENEFGEIGIDHDLVIGADSDIFEMNNGCICCSIKGDLIETLNRLIGKREKFDRILIESTGLASPGPLAQAFLVDNELATSLKFDGVASLVDAKNFRKQLEEIDVAGEQTAFSNAILINKTDLASAEELDKIETLVRQINPTAKIFRTRHAVVDLDQILDMGGFELDPTREFDLDRPLDIPRSSEASLPIESVSLSLPGNIDLGRFRMWLQMLGIMEGMDVMRAKGILSLPDSPDRWIFQSVYMMFDAKAQKPWGGDPRENRFVFIGRNLDRQKLEAGIRNLLGN